MEVGGGENPRRTTIPLPLPSPAVAGRCRRPCTAPRPTSMGRRSTGNGKTSESLPSTLPLVVEGVGPELAPGDGPGDGRPGRGAVGEERRGLVRLVLRLGVHVPAAARAQKISRQAASQAARRRSAAGRGASVWGVFPIRIRDLSERDFGDGLGFEAFQEPRGLDEVELRVVRLDAEEEPVLRRPLEPGDVEDAGCTAGAVRSGTASRRPPWPRPGARSTRT